MKKSLTATVIASALFAVGCSKSPEPQASKNVISDAAHAQGGVCMNETFSFMFGERTHGRAKPVRKSEDGATVTLEVQTDMSPKVIGWGYRGDSGYDQSIEIQGFPLKPAQQCTFNG